MRDGGRNGEREIQIHRCEGKETNRRIVTRDGDRDEDKDLDRDNQQRRSQILLEFD